MKIRTGIRILIVGLVCMAAGWFVGARNMEVRIRMACENDPGVTDIGGAQFYCLTREQLRGVVQQLSQRGA